MKAKHTPIPYEDTGNSEVIKIQDAINLQTVAFLRLGYPKNKANAEFIVRACNCHDELVEALKTTRGLLVGLDSVSETPRFMKYIEFIDKVLAKAEEKS